MTLLFSTEPAEKRIALTQELAKDAAELAELARKYAEHAADALRRCDRMDSMRLTNLVWFLASQSRYLADLAQETVLDCQATLEARASARAAWATLEELRRVGDELFK